MCKRAVCRPQKSHTQSTRVLITLARAGFPHRPSFLFFLFLFFFPLARAGFPHRYPGGREGGVRGQVRQGSAVLVCGSFVSDTRLFYTYLLLFTHIFCRFCSALCVALWWATYGSFTHTLSMCGSLVGDIRVFYTYLVYVWLFGGRHTALLHIPCLCVALLHIPSPFYAYLLQVLQCVADKSNKNGLVFLQFDSIESAAKVHTSLL